MKYSKSATIKFAVQKSLPVLFGYLFLGSAFGTAVPSGKITRIQLDLGDNNFNNRICRLGSVFACVADKRKGKFADGGADDIFHQHTAYVLRLILHR